MYYVFGALFLTAVIVWWMPKRVTRLEIYVTWAILAGITYIVDILTGVVWDEFDYGIDAKVRIPEMIIECTVAPAFGVIFYNFMPKAWKKFLPYMLIWVAFSLLFEWGAVHSGFLKYKGWSLYRSVPFYFGTFLYLRWHHHYLHNRVIRKR